MGSVGHEAWISRMLVLYVYIYWLFAHQVPLFFDLYQLLLASTLHPKAFQRSAPGIMLGGK